MDTTSVDSVNYQNSNTPRKSLWGNLTNAMTTVRSMITLISEVVREGIEAEAAFRESQRR